MKFLHQLATEGFTGNGSVGRFIYQGDRPRRAPEAAPDPREALEALALDEAQTAAHEHALGIALARWAARTNQAFYDVNDNLDPTQLFLVDGAGNIRIQAERALGNDVQEVVINANQLSALGVDPETALTFFAAHYREFVALDDDQTTEFGEAVMAGAINIDPFGGAVLPDQSAVIPEEDEFGGVRLPESGPEDFSADLDIAALNSALTVAGIDEQVVSINFDALSNSYAVVLNDGTSEAIAGSSVTDAASLEAAIREVLGVDVAPPVVAAAPTALPPEAYDVNEADATQKRDLQQLLTRAGYNTGGVGNGWGPASRRALQSAQEAAGLDGASTVVTPALVDFLNNRIQGIERADFIEDGIERHRSNREFIRAVQRLIKPADAPDSWVDGSWGNLSRAALSAANQTVLEQVQALLDGQEVTEHLERARTALGEARAAEIDALIENGASIEDLAALTSPEASGGMGNRNLVAQYLQARYEADGRDFSELAVAIMAQYQCPEDWTVRQALHPAQNGNDEAYFREFRRNGRESYYRIGYRVKQNELVRAVENSEVSLTIGEAFNVEANTITIGDQVIQLPTNARLHMATGNEAGRADGWMDMTLAQAADFEISNVVYDPESGAVYFIMNNGCHGNPGVITVEQGIIPLPRRQTTPQRPSNGPTRVRIPDNPEDEVPVGRCEIVPEHCFGGRRAYYEICYDGYGNRISRRRHHYEWDPTCERSGGDDGCCGADTGGGSGPGTGEGTF